MWFVLVRMEPKQDVHMILTYDGSEYNISLGLTKFFVVRMIYLRNMQRVVWAVNSIRR